RSRRDSRLPAHIRERAVTIVVKQLDESCGQTSRTTIDRHAFPATVRVLARLRQLVERGVQIRGNKEIQPAVAIVVDPRAAGAVTDCLLLEAGLLGDVGKRSITVVVVQHIVTVVRDEKIVEAVVVVITNGYRRGPPGTRQAGLCGY